MGWKATGRGGIVAAWAAAAVCAAAPSPGYEFRRAPDGTPLRWERSPDPIPYAIVCPGGNEIPDEGAVGAIQDAFAAWEGVGTADVRFRFAGIAPDADGAAAGMVIWLRDDWPYDRLTIAKTRLHYRREDGAIVKAEILLNARDYRWSADGTPGTLDIRNAATHEIGHFLGLDDVSTPGRTMYEYIGLDERDKTFLSDDELEGSAPPIRGSFRRPPSPSRPSPRPPRRGAPPLGGSPRSAPGRSSRPPARSPGPSPASSSRPAASSPSASPPPTEQARAKSRSTPAASTRAGCGRCRPSARAGRARAAPAAIVSTEQGAALALGAIPPESGDADGITMRLFPLDGADEVVAFAPLGPAGEGFDDAFAVFEKQRTGDQLISVAHLLPARRPGGGFVLSFLRSWTAPDCARVEGFAVLEGLGGRREIAALARGARGRLEMLFYAAPFSFLPADGSPVEPAFRADASALDDAGDALGIAALPPDGSGRRRLAALIAR